MDRDYLQDALQTFNDINGVNWYGWQTHDDNGNKIPNSERMQYQYIKIIKDGATMPSEEEVNAKYKLKDAETQKANDKISAQNKLKALGLTDAEIEHYNMAYIGKDPIVGNFQVCDAISVVNGQASYTMQASVNVTPESANHMLVSLNGILQTKLIIYYSGSTITFASNLATGDVIDFIMLLGVF